MHRNKAAIYTLVIAACFGCKPAEEVMEPPAGPTTETSDKEIPETTLTESWADTDITCGADADCLADESCIEGVCQVEKCQGTLDPSAAPLGQTLTFLSDKDIGIVDANPWQGDFWVDGYAAENGVPWGDAWTGGNRAIVDVAGGDFLGTRPEAFAIIENGQSTVTLLSDNGNISVNLTFTPIAIAAGDLDGDGLDELVAVSNSDDLAICHFDTQTCEEDTYGAAPRVTVDVAVGDIDGDALAEPILLYARNGERYLYGINLDAEITGQDTDTWLMQTEDGDNPVRIAAADLDGDRIAEIAALWDDECGDWCDDWLQTFKPTPAAGEAGFVLDKELEFNGVETLLDIDAADTDLDDSADIVVTGYQGHVIGVHHTGQNLVRSYQNIINITSEPKRIALADHDGDSPRATLRGSPELVHGDTVPLMLMLLPPYDLEHSSGPSWASYGDETSNSDERSETVSMGMHVDVGVQADFWGMFGASMSTKVEWGLERSQSASQTVTVGSNYAVVADPALFGPNYGAVVLSWGCFDAYTYDVDDPAGVIENGDGQPLVLTVPVGGGTSLWSTSRYNAMAEAVGDMPVLDIPYAVGDIDSYPSDPETLDGTPLSPDDLVFPYPDGHPVSDVGEVSWVMSVADAETNSETLTTSMGASAGVIVAGVSVGGGASYGWGEGYSMTVGSASHFSGGLPSLPNDPATEIDEYSAHRYTATPYVYRHNYTDGNGGDASLYVQTYTAN